MAYLVASGSTGNVTALSNTWLENPKSALKTSRRRTNGTGTRGSRSSPHTVTAEATMLAKTMRSTNGASHAAQVEHASDVPRDQVASRADKTGESVTDGPLDARP